ncbi:MAG TPA: acyl-CoA thioesterase [Leeuwenhoekiella sp.]|nr:acyl-CoA thioesterase [Leeuwenhoekiella sp.]
MPNKFKNIAESQITMSQLMLPSNTNFSGKIHGGFILSLMDQIAFACASKHSRNYCVTASVDTVDFLKPIEVGELVMLKASVNYVGRTSMVIGIRVEAENIPSGEIKHCNSSYFTMVAKDDAGKSVPVPGLILKTETHIRRFIKSMKRQEMKGDRKNEFKSTDFVSKAYIENLENHNIKLEY